MGFEKLDNNNWQTAFRRALIHGWPYAWKTTSIFLDSDGKPDKAWPRPIGYLAYPGEQGTGAIPIQMPGIIARIWRTDHTQKQDPVRDWLEVQKETKAILTGKYGEIQTFAGDGLHKLYQLIYQAKLLELQEAFPNQDPEKLGGRAYGLAHKEFLEYLEGVTSSAIPYVVFTCWAALEKDDPQQAKGPMHIYPDLPGTMRQWVLGEFGCVLYAEPGQEVAAGKFTKGRWQTRPAGKVWGVGLKVPREIAKRIPTYVPQDWGTLEQLVFGPPPTTQAVQKQAE